MDLVVDFFFLFFFFFSSPFTSGIEKERKKKERQREKKYCGIFLRNAIYFLPFYFNDLDSLLWGVWWFRLLSRTGFLLFSLFFFFLAYCFMGFYFLFLTFSFSLFASFLSNIFGKLLLFRCQLTLFQQLKSQPFYLIFVLFLLFFLLFFLYRSLNISSFL